MDTLLLHTQLFCAAQDFLLSLLDTHIPHNHKSFFLRGLGRHTLYTDLWKSSALLKQRSQEPKHPCSMSSIIRLQAFCSLLCFHKIVKTKKGWTHMVLLTYPKRGKVTVFEYCTLFKGGKEKGGGSEIFRTKLYCSLLCFHKIGPTKKGWTFMFLIKWNPDAHNQINDITDL